MSLIQTRLLAMRPESPIDKWETRASRWGMFNYFRDQTEADGGILSDDLKEQARNSIGRDLEIPVIDYDNGVTIQSVTQPLTIVGDPSTSQMYAITFVLYYFGFLIHPAQHRNNKITMQREFMEQIKKYDFALMQKMDVDAGVALEADKTQVAADLLAGRYTFVNDVVGAPPAEHPYFLGDLDVIKMGNDFMGPYTVIGNGSMQSHVRKIMEKDQYQTDNKRYQWDSKSWYWSKNIANDPAHLATGYMIQDGSVGMLEQFNADNLMGHSTHKHTWGIAQLPYSGIRMGTFEYDDAVDGTGLQGAGSAHLTATKVEAYGFAKGVAYVTPYNSDKATRSSAIMKIALNAPV